MNIQYINVWTSQETMLTLFLISRLDSVEKWYPSKVAILSCGKQEVLSFLKAGGSFGITLLKLHKDLKKWQNLCGSRTAFILAGLAVMKAEWQTWTKIKTVDNDHIKEQTKAKEAEKNLNKNR